MKKHVTWNQNIKKPFIYRSYRYCAVCRKVIEEYPIRCPHCCKFVHREPECFHEEIESSICSKCLF